ncbi:MAG: lipid A phosphoethanolamine transferase [Selenomonadaceae bacterium]|nr:lipid A phosphoethanolamine transferase [Selenomonadaceae bacterium]
MEQNGIKNASLRLWEAIEQTFTEHTGFLFLLFFFNYFTMVWSLLLKQEILLTLGYGLALFFCFVLLMAVLRRFLSGVWISRVKTALLIVSILMFGMESFVMYTYEALIGAGIVNSVLETNRKEAVEFLQMYVTWRELGAVLLGGVVIFFAWRRLRDVSLSDAWKRSLCRGLMAAGLISLVAVLPYYAEFFACELLPAARIVGATSLAVENAIAYHRLADAIDTHIDLTENNSEIKNIVFILGESTNRNHMHLYGYYLSNTPHLDEMQAKGEIVAMSDVISPHSTTVEVLSELFTFCDYESDKSWYEYHNLIDVMNAAGYRTHWLSNQESSGMWGNVAQLYANHSTMHKFTRLRDSLEDSGILDEELFPLLDEALADASPDRNFYVLHLMGGHGLYYNRYPYAFHKFKAEDVKLQIGERYRDIVAQYDNALYYNDYIVSEIINRFRDKEALVIYVPDHGEAVYDEGGSIAGHLEENPDRHMIEIPVIFWASRKFRDKYPEKWEAIEDAADRPYRTDDMIHTLMELAGIKTEEWNPQKSVVNEEFDASRPRFFGEENYDTQIRGK